MNQPRKQHSAVKKVEILREHLENQVPISELSRRFELNPNLIHKWKKQLFESGVEVFSRNNEKALQGQNARIGLLEEKIKDRDSLIAEIMSDNIRLKKKLNGEI
ncbi:MAG TPA: transposase [Ignavibacteria bacterium]|nr:transposase [Ignavibacteria bacterium]